MNTKSNSQLYRLGGWSTSFEVYIQYYTCYRLKKRFDSYIELTNKMLCVISLCTTHISVHFPLILLATYNYNVYILLAVFCCIRIGWYLIRIWKYWLGVTFIQLLLLITVIIKTYNKVINTAIGVANHSLIGYNWMELRLHNPSIEPNVTFYFIHCIIQFNKM